MRVPQNGRPANIINHVVVAADESASMHHLAGTLVKVFNNLIAHLASQSRANGQETRVTVYFFSSRGTGRCVIYDMDVLRTPTIDGLYAPGGMTALIDAVMLSIEDQRMIPQKYGDHSFLTLVLTDGQENASRHSSYDLTRAIEGAPENETYGVFVPDQMGVHEAKRHGFPSANISVWDATSAHGMEEVGRVMRDVADAYMEGRASGVRGYSARSGGGLFKLREFSAAEVQQALTPLDMNEYLMLNVPATAEIRPFVEAAGMTYDRGNCFYQFTKRETIQADKRIAVEQVSTYGDTRIYTGKQARQILGLPDHEVKVSPDHKPGCTIFVQSKSVNRKLMPGTRLLVLR